MNNPVVTGERKERERRRKKFCVRVFSARKNKRNCSGLARLGVLLGIVSNWVEPITFVTRKLMLL